MIGKDHSTRLNTLAALNTALGNLNPPIDARTLVGMVAPGATTAMLDAVIADDNTVLYDSMDARDLPDLATPLRERVNTHPIKFEYDPHGDKHFPGGQKSDSKFVMGKATKATVNDYLRDMIKPLVGRIRRDANGIARSYYLTVVPGVYTAPSSLTVQVDYVPESQSEKIVFHGYPDASVIRHSLSRTKGGQAIP